jgi:predicted ester cyclase
MAMDTSTDSAEASLGKLNLRRIVMEAFSEGRLDVLDEVLTDDFVNHGAPPGLSQGIDGVRKVIEMERSGFPDLQYSVLHEVEDGDMIVQHCEVSGTHLGEIFGMPPTGRRVVWNEIHIGRMVDGRAAEHWACNDMHRVWVQIGRVAPPQVKMPGGGVVGAATVGHPS